MAVIKHENWMNMYLCIQFAFQNYWRKDNIDLITLNIKDS